MKSNTGMITIQELLFNRKLDQTARIKLVRHKDARCDLYDKYRTDHAWFLEYQSAQANPVFRDVDYIVSFIGEEGSSARFIGVYQILGKQENSEYNRESFTTSKYCYKMQEVNGFDGLKERVIIRWTNPISWHQWIKNEMEVIEIQRGFNDKSFTDYYSFILDFPALKEIITEEYKDWKQMLSATKGIYLISDVKSGKQYIGSAYNIDGIWGRWSEYVRTNGHGNNKTLKELVASDKDYANNFRFSILMLLPSTVTNKEAIEKEQLFKRKLGTNAFGLNNN